MQRNGRRRTLTYLRTSLLAIAALAIGIGVGAMPGLSRNDPVRRQASPLRVSSVLPAWLAPGAPLTIRGFTGARQTVLLRSNGRPAGRARSGRFGGFVIHSVAPGAGAHELVVTTASRRQRLGRLTVRPVLLAAVGDVTPGEAVGPTIESRGAAYPWGEVGRVLRSADIATANLEGVVSSEGAPVPGKEYHFEGPAALLSGARTYGGIDVLTLANNHTLDYGAIALSDTLVAAHRAGISTIGAGMALAQARTPAFVRAGGLTIAFLGYSDVNPAGFVATSSSAGTARADVAAIAADVRAARKKADVVVCWFHWGVELQPLPDGRQRMFAEAALAAGAQVVLGAHPHVFGALERPTPRTLVAWTLGNFVFPSSRAATTRTGILLVALGAHGVRGSRVVPATAGVRPQLG